MLSLIAVPEIYFDGKCFLCCVLFLVIEIFYCKKIELKTFDDLYVTAGYRPNSVVIPDREIENRQRKNEIMFIALVLLLGLDSILSTLRTVYILYTRFW